MTPKIIRIPVLDYELVADMYEVEDAKSILLFLIGNGSNRASYANLAPQIAKKTESIAIVLDYSGHGDSPFKFEDVSLAHNFMDVVCTFDFLKEKFPDLPVCIIGNSVGGFLAANLTKYREFEKLILRVPALYIPSIFYNPRSNYNWEESNRYRNDAERTAVHPIITRAKKFSGKTFVITHENDDICPPATTDRFIESFEADHWEAKGFVHGFGDSSPTEEQLEEYRNAISNWINAN